MFNTFDDETAQLTKQQTAKKTKAVAKNFIFFFRNMSAFSGDSANSVDSQQDGGTSFIYRSILLYEY